ncbi:S-layer homology domain-containing protein [Leptolyngbyaceae cyanobacterium UHCC 1019]
MSNSSPPGQRPPHLRDDEPIALLIAALSFGAIFFWIFNQNQQQFSLGNFLKKAGETKAPQVITVPLPQPTEPEIPGIKKSPPLEDPAQQLTPPGATAPVAPVPPPATVVPSPSAQLAPTPIQPSGTPLSFVDVPTNYWAYSAIAALSAQGIISGYPDGTFKPDQPVNRSEFAIQLQKAYAKPNQMPAIAFLDVRQGDWRLPAIDQAVKMNFMRGYPDKTFRPTQKVSRMEAAVSMAKGLGLPVPSDPEAILQSYPDQNQVPAWARSLLAAAIQAELVSGDPDTKQLNPNQAASRADVAAFVYKGQKLGAK